jgi:Golgi phosphoprotein 3 GPP34
LIAKVRKRLRATLLERLTAAGALRRSTRKVLGIPWRTTWPAGDSSHKRELRARLQDVLVAGATPDGRTAALVSLLVAVKAAPKVVDGDKKAVRARAKDIAAGDWAGAAVKKAINAVNATQASVIIGAGAAAAVVRLAGSSSSSWVVYDRGGNLDGWLAVCRRAWGRVGQDAAERERAEVGAPIRPTQDRKPRTTLDGAGSDSRRADLDMASPGSGSW